MYVLIYLSLPRTPNEGDGVEWGQWGYGPSFFWNHNFVIEAFIETCFCAIIYSIQDEDPSLYIL